MSGKSYIYFVLFFALGFFLVSTLVYFFSVSYAYADENLIVQELYNTSIGTFSESANTHVIRFTPSQDYEITTITWKGNEGSEFSGSFDIWVTDGADSSIEGDTSLTQFVDGSDWLRDTEVSGVDNEMIKRQSIMATTSSVTFQSSKTYYIEMGVDVDVATTTAYNSDVNSEIAISKKYIADSAWREDEYANVDPTVIFANQDTPAWIEIDDIVTATNSYLDIIKPEQATSTNSRTIDIEIDAFKLVSEARDLGYLSEFSKIYVDFSSLAYPNDDIERVILDSEDWGEEFTVSTTTTLNRDGQYLVLAYFTNEINETWLTDDVTFNAATTTLEIDVPFDNPETICDGGNFVEGGFCKVMMFLFYPSDSSADRFFSLKDEIDTKIPFAYYDLLNTKLENVNSTSTSPFQDFDVNVGTSTYGLGNVKIVDWSEAKDTIGQDNLDTIETWLVNIIWILFGIYIAGRTITFAQKI